MKSWYKLRNVEYSTDFQFFLKEQIIGWFTNNRRHLTLTSGLESFRFIILIQPDEITDKTLLKLCKTVHEQLLKGFYGNGEFVD